MRLNISPRPSLVSGEKAELCIKYLFAAVSLCLLMVFGTSSALAQSLSLVSVNKDGTGSSNGNISPITAVTVTNGRYVVFTSTATNLVAQPDTNNANDVFVRDLTTGVTTLVSVNASGTGAGNGKSGVRTLTATMVQADLSLSANGRHVVFTSSASDLVANDTNGKEDIFVRGLETGG